MFKHVIDRYQDERIVALDIETTGEKGENNRIIQIGVIELVKGEINTKYSCLFGGGKSTKWAFDVHKIHDRQRENESHFEERMLGIKKFISDAVIVGHNVKAFDLRIINEKLQTIDDCLGNIRYIDTLKIVRDLKLGFKNNSLSTLCFELGLSYGNHDALGDAESSLLILNSILSKKNISKRDSINMISSDYFGKTK